MSPRRISDITRSHRSETMAVLFIFIALVGLAILLIEQDASRFNANCVREYFCVNECPVGAIILDEHGFPSINKSTCLAWVPGKERFQWNKCGLCLRGCPTRVIDLLDTELEEREKHTVE